MAKENPGPRSWTVQEALKELHSFEVILTNSAATYAEKGDIGGMVSKLEKAAGLGFLQQVLKEDPESILRIINRNLDLAKAVDEVVHIRSLSQEEASGMMTSIIGWYVEQLRPHARSGIATKAYDEILRLVQALQNKQVEGSSAITTETTGNEALLFKAIHDNDIEGVRRFVKVAQIDEKDSALHGYTPLIYAVSLGRANVVEVLLQARADPNLTSDKSGQTALMKAAGQNLIDIVLLLINAGANLNIKDNEGHTALTIGTSFSASVELLEELIRKGVDVNSTTRYGQTALMFASIHNRVDILDLLLSAGANRDTMDEDGNTALLHGSANGNTEVVKALLQAGADVNIQSKDGNTPLMAATYQGYIEELKLLLAAGADVNKKNVDGTTALQYAMICRQEAKRTELKKLLEDAGASPATEIHVVNSGPSVERQMLDLLSLEKEDVNQRGRELRFEYVKNIFAKKFPTHFFWQDVTTEREMSFRELALNASLRSEYEKAIEYSKAGLELNPRSAYLHYMKGRSEGDRGKYQDGLNDLDEAIRLRPDFADAYVERGVIRRKMGQESVALNNFKIAKNIDSSIVTPDSPMQRR